MVNNVQNAFGLSVAGALPFSENILALESQSIFLEKYPDHAFSNEIRNISSRVFGVKPKSQLEVMHDLLGMVRVGFLG